MKRNQHPRGFTLVEVLIVLAIISILAAVAVPSYQAYVERGRRADAIASLLNLQIQEEKWRANNTTYGSLSDLGWSGGDGNSTDGYYTITVSGASASGYTATAAPTGVQAEDDCGSYVMNQDGPDYSGGAGEKCWGH